MDMVAIAIAVAGSVAALVSLYFAHRSASAAKQSADAAKQSLSLQRDAAREAKLADVRALRWESGGGRTGPIGLQLKNFGPAAAHDIVGEVRMGETFRRGGVTAMSPEEVVGLSQQLQDFLPDAPDVIPVPGLKQMAARVAWVNADGSSGLRDWALVENL